MIDIYKQATELLLGYFLEEDCIGVFIYCVNSSKLPITLLAINKIENIESKSGIVRAVEKYLGVLDSESDDTVEKRTLNALRKDLFNYGMWA